LIEETFRKTKKLVGTSWRMDETYIKVKGEWKLLYRAVDKDGNTIDYLLTKRRNKYAAHKFLLKAIKTYNRRWFRRIKIRQCKYLNNRIEGDYRFMKRRTLHMLKLKIFDTT
jgi:putative transposase